MAYDLRLSHVGKRYRVSRRRGARPSWRSVFRPAMDDFWALRDIDFEVPSGQALGIIGPNGAGKSTLFKLLAGITAPSEGEIRIRGRLAALIEVGSGFHPELTGRENVFLSGTILGLRRRDIAARLAGIIEFAGIGGFLDVPVKWYSSGMYVRLGFAVAAQLEPDVLLVDEVLAVGDAAFQAKCVQRIIDLRQRGTTILVISHDSGHDRATPRLGAVPERRAGGRRRRPFRHRLGLPAAGQSDYRPPSAGGAPERSVAIMGLSVHNHGGDDVIVARSGDSVRIVLELRVQAPSPALVAEVMVYSHEEGLLLFECATPPDGIQLADGNVRVRFDISSLGLLPGAYTLGATVRPAGSSRAIDWWFGLYHAARRIRATLTGPRLPAGTTGRSFRCRPVRPLRRGPRRPPRSGPRTPVPAPGP